MTLNRLKQQFLLTHNLVTKNSKSAERKKTRATKQNAINPHSTIPTVRILDFEPYTVTIEDSLITFAFNSFTVL